MRKMFRTLDRKSQEKQKRRCRMKKRDSKKISWNIVAESERKSSSTSA